MDRPPEAVDAVNVDVGGTYLYRLLWTLQTGGLDGDSQDAEQSDASPPCPATAVSYTHGQFPYGEQQQDMN